MEITVSARHTDISPALRAAAEEKIGRLSRFLGEMDRAEVHFSEEHNPRIADKEWCEVTLTGHGHHVRCKVAAPDSRGRTENSCGIYVVSPDGSGLRKLADRSSAPGLTRRASSLR